MEVIDGSYHPVDSDQLSFELAARMAFRHACPKCHPVLMEPIMSLEVVTPEDYMGDIVGDLNRRRGQIVAMDSTANGARIVKAFVPLSEQFGYVTVHRAAYAVLRTRHQHHDLRPLRRGPRQPGQGHRGKERLSCNG